MARLRTLPTAVGRDDVMADDGARSSRAAAGAGRAPRVVPIGLGAATLTVVGLELDDGDHVLVAGPPRSGRTSASAWLAGQLAVSGDDVVVLTGRGDRTWLGSEGPWRVTGTVEDALRETRNGARILVVDDAERVEDDGGLAAVLTCGAVTAIVTMCTDAVVPFGHWTHVVRRRRTGLILGAANGTDGDLLGVVLPRRWPVPPSPGRGWFVDAGVCRGVVQVPLSEVSPRTGEPTVRPGSA